jgi:two-component system response regulator NreC
MSQISIGILDEHVIVQEGIAALLSDVENIEVTLTTGNVIELVEALKLTPVNVLIINIHVLNIQVINLIKQLSANNPKTKILVLSVHNSEDVILKTIKAGAKGFLSSSSGKTELLEAIYTLRGGFDYYSKSITQIILKRYIDNIELDEKNQRNDIKVLTSREIEILQLWGKNYSNKAIADKLFISLRTVESHKNHIMQKLNLNTTVDLVKFAIKNNIIDIE